MIRIPVTNRIYIKSFVESDGKKYPECLLTYPEPDAAGDIIKPDGGNWDYHDRHPLLNRRVNFDHGVLIGRAENPDGSYGVSLRAVELEDGKTAKLPIGVTKFFQTASDIKGLVKQPAGIRTSLQVAEQVEDLVSRKIMRGVSLELGEDERKPGLWKSLGKSPLENRNAWQCNYWIGLGYAHTFMPLNKHSQVLDGSVDDLISLAESGRLGSKPLAAPLMKSLSAYRSVPRPPVVKSGFTSLRKSMNDQNLEENEITEDVASEDTPGANKPTPNAIHQILQAITDVSLMIDQIINGPDHEHAEGLALLGEVKAQFEAAALDLMGKAAELFPDAGFEQAEAEEEPTGEETNTEPDGDESPLQTTDDGGLMTKAFKRGYPRRFATISSRTLNKSEPGTVTISVAMLDRLRKTLATIGKKK